MVRTIDTQFPDTAEQAGSRRSVVPDAAGRSLWLAAAWTGLGTAIVCATVAIVVVAVCWLPVSGTTGRTNSSIRAGLLSFLASVHGGITVDGVNVAWLPLGLSLFVALTAWRAGSGLGDAAAALGERGPLRLVLAGMAQALSFTVGCLVAAPFATLGTSRAPFLGVAAGAGALFVIFGGTAFVRSCALREWCIDRAPAWFATVARAGGAAVLVYLVAGALLVAGSLILHHTAVELLSRQVGGGWGGVPVVLLSLLSAPNAMIAGASYLAGPGFAVGTATNVSLFSTAYGTLPAFPLLAALPVGHGANRLVWAVVAATPLLAGVTVARLVVRTAGWWRRIALSLGAAAFAGLVMLILAWQGGGAVGDGRLRVVGASPVRLAGAVAAAVAFVACGALGLAATWLALRNRANRAGDGDKLLSARLSVVTARGAGVTDNNEQGELAG